MSDTIDIFSETQMKFIVSAVSLTNSIPCNKAERDMKHSSYYTKQL